MTEIKLWLSSNGLAEYADAFAKHRIEIEDLADLTDADLAELGLPIGPRKRFCRAVGQLVNDPAKSATDGPQSLGREAERRHLTVMFADIVDSTALSQVVDSEDLREIGRTYHKAIRHIVEGYGGYVAQYLGDGVLCYFGYPQAHEDDADRAILAGLDIVKSVGEISLAPLANANFKLATRVGIATGTVVIGDTIGDGDSSDRLAVGETLNLAHRVQSAAEPNSVVISPATHRLVRGSFKFASIGLQRLKGFVDEVELWRVTDQRSNPSRFQSRQHALASPLVGRRAEFQALREHWQMARNGHGHATLISGEPGIGKSRLAMALRDIARESPHNWFLFQCSPHHSNVPFHPITTRLIYSSGLSKIVESGARAEHIRAFLNAVPELGEEDIISIAELLGVEPADGSLLDPRTGKARVLRALSRYLGGLARRMPVLCLFEDLHWADASTLELVSQLMTQRDDSGTLLLLTCRPEFKAPWIGTPNTSLLALGRLGSRDCRALIETQATLGAIPSELVQSIAVRADGVPLFLEELTHFALAERALPEAISESEPTLSGTNDIPVTLRDVLMSRLDRLPRARNVAQVASVLGRDFRYAFFEDISHDLSIDVRQGVEELASSGLIEVRGDLPNAWCRFRHMLIRDVAYSTLTRKRRTELHKKIAQALIDQADHAAGVEKFDTPDALNPAVVAYHLTEAGLDEQGADYWAKAGDQALASAAPKEAAANFAKAVELQRRLDKSPQRSEKELSLLLRLGQAQFGAFGGAHRRTVETYEAASVLARENGSFVDRCQVDYGLWINLTIAGRTVEGLSVAERLLRTGEDTGIKWIEAVANRLVGMSYNMIGDLQRARTALQRVISLRTEIDAAPSGFAHHPYLTAAPILSHVEWALGRPDTALHLAEQALDEIKACSPEPNTIAFALVWLIILRLLRREPEPARELALQLRNETEKGSANFWAQLIPWGLGGFELLRGNAEGALPMLREGIRGFTSTGSRQHLPLVKLLEVEALFQVGTYDQSLIALDETEEIVRQTDQRFYQPDLHRWRGNLLAATADTEEAEHEYRRAMTVAEQQGSKAWRLRAALELARLWTTQAKREDARTLLSSELDRFSEGFDTPDLKAAKTGILESS